MYLGGGLFFPRRRKCVVGVVLMRSRCIYATRYTDIARLSLAEYPDDGANCSSVGDLVSSMEF